MKKHSENESVSTQISYIFNSTKLRLARFQLSIIPPNEQNPVVEESFIFDDGPVRIGSLPNENHIVLSDETVSRKHCEITREGDSYVLRDLGSTNGTFVNHVRVREIYLDPGVECQIGQTMVTFDSVQDEMSLLPSKKNRFGRLIGGDIKMREIFSIIEKISHTDTTVIIEGETGTGKDVLAQTIHETSIRSGKPFVVVDCSAIPEHLIESELFGHEKGSFTGAIMARKGLFEQANGGTIFLDELGELSLELQPKLLRVLETRKVRRVGGQSLSPVDVRVVAATNRNLEEEVRAGRFREDLFYRLSVVRIFLPPLRERIADLSLLIEHFMQTSQFNFTTQGTLKLKSVSKDALSMMMLHKWPGNVRELINVIERACTFTEGNILTSENLPQTMQRSNQIDHLNIHNRDTLSSLTIQDIDRKLSKADDTLNEPTNQHFFGEEDTSETEQTFEQFKVAKERWISLFEKDYLLTALKRSRYNISHASREAGIDRKYFRKLMHKYSIEVP
jgi:transcriptional regulator with GAF, ATPase, and Fis domain